MRSLVPVAAAGLLLFGSVALIARQRSSDPYSQKHLTALLEAPLTRPEKEATTVSEPFWRALLAHPRVRRTETGLELPLGRIQADPTIARSAALAAGELLALRSRDPSGKEGAALWEVILASSAAREENGQRFVRLFGCRASGTPDAAPALEDSYHARVALAEGLQRLAAAAGVALVVEGLEAPVQGGANFELAWAGGRQHLDVTFANEPQKKWSVEREFAAVAPADAAARATFVAALTELARRDAQLGPLTLLGQESAQPDGIDVRLELLGGRLSALTSSSQGRRLSAYIPLGPTAR
jgi:hypothetical protein